MIRFEVYKTVGDSIFFVEFEITFTARNFARVCGMRTSRNIVVF